jgi:hypothetical protein
MTDTDTALAEWMRDYIAWSDADMAGDIDWAKRARLLDIALFLIANRPDRLPLVIEIVSSERRRRLDYFSQKHKVSA